MKMFGIIDRVVCYLIIPVVSIASFVFGISLCILAMDKDKGKSKSDKLKSFCDSYYSKINE